MSPKFAFFSGSSPERSKHGSLFLSPIFEHGFHLTNSTHECLAPRSSTQLFCVYSFGSFANGRGLSVVTTPQRIELIQSLPAFMEGTTMGMNENSSSYEVTKLPNRGYGLIAKKTLHRGDRVFANTPIILLDAEAQSLGEVGWIELENIAVSQLPSETRRLFWGLHGQGGSESDPANDRINTNSFEIEIGDLTYYAVFPETSVKQIHVATNTFHG